MQLDHSISGQCCHHFDHEGAWERVSDEEALKARELETAAEQMAAAEHASVISKDESNLRWSCDHCDGDKFWGRAGIITHLSNKLSVHHNFKDRKEVYKNLLLHQTLYLPSNRRGRLLS